MLPEDDHVIKTCRSVLNILMQILDFLNNIYIYIYVHVLVCVIKLNTLLPLILNAHSSNCFHVYLPLSCKLHQVSSWAGIA